MRLVQQHCAEVAARWGADPAVEADGWVPAALSGAPVPPGDDGPAVVTERVILDLEAFGAPLTSTEYAELNRLRRRGTLLDARGHVTGQIAYPAGAPDAAGAENLIHPGRGHLDLPEILLAVTARDRDPLGSPGVQERADQRPLPVSDIARIPLAITHDQTNTPADDQDVTGIHLSLHRVITIYREPAERSPSGPNV